MKYLLMIIIMLSCKSAEVDYGKDECRQYATNMKICKVDRYKGSEVEFCELRIKRPSPYNQTVTNKFRCVGVF